MNLCDTMSLNKTVMFHKSFKKYKLTIVVFIILVIFASVISNTFFPIYGDCCFVPVTSQRYGVGFDCIDLNECNKCNIVVSNNPDYGVEEVAVSALTRILSLLWGIVQYDYITNDLIK